MNDNMFDELVASVREMDAITNNNAKASRTFEFPELKVKAVREKVGLSQQDFAMLIGVSKRTIENWEQGRRQPTGPAKALLRILNVDPKHAIEALHV